MKLQIKEPKLIIEPIPWGKTLQADEIIFIKTTVGEYLESGEGDVDNKNTYQIAEANNENV